MHIPFYHLCVILIPSGKNCNIFSKKSDTVPLGSQNIHSSPVDQSDISLSSLNDISLDYVTDDIQGISNSGTQTDRNLSAIKYLIGPSEIAAIQAAISSTCRPSWQQSPPKAFGTSQQGKLKADQWRTLLEFDLPVTLVELWVDSENLECER